MREESRSMTLGDVVAMVAGVGLGLAASPRPSGPVPPRVMLLFSITWGLWALAVMLALVVLTRLIRHRRGASPAEWLAILMAVSGLAYRADWGVDRAVASIFATFRRSDVSFAPFRWLLAGGASVAIGSGLVGLRLGRRFLPPWVKTVVLAGLAALALWGPVEVIGLQGPDLLTPGGGFLGGDSWILCRRICILLAQVPFGLMFGVPLVAAIAERIARRPWTWVDWASFALVVASAWLLPSAYPGDFDRPSLAWAAERGIVALWAINVAVLSRWIVVWAAPGWRRWLGLGS